jgi:hypothetical protein
VDFGETYGLENCTIMSDVDGLDGEKSQCLLKDRVAIIIERESPSYNKVLRANFFTKKRL